jgi:hypothetical protein
LTEVYRRMALPTRVVDATEIEKIGRYLGSSKARPLVFECVYRGGKKPKSAEFIAKKTRLTRVKALQVATPMALKGYIGSEKVGGVKCFTKQDDLISSRDKILRWARNKKWLKAQAKVGQPSVNLTVRVVEGERIRVDAITMDSIDNFKNARQIRPPKARKISPAQLREGLFKKGVARILGENGRFTDWGGEKNDLYTDHVRIAGKRRRTAIAFKGVGTRPPLTLKKLGKNADQIPRLFESAAEVFLIQFEGQIVEAVIDQMETYAIRKSKQSGQHIRFGVIDGDDSHRLRAAYPKSFTP